MKNICLIDFIENVETYIHAEVKKLYPDAELPTFEIVFKDENKIEFNYVSDKKLHHLAKGLLIGAAKHFNQTVNIEMIDNGEKVHFVISLEET